MLTLMSIQMIWAQSSEIPKIDLTLKNFYVKEEGKGDGSSWEKAMGPSTFAYYLSQVKEGTTFYVAKGTYKPDSVYSKQEKGAYFANANIKGVSIIGGFPSHVKSDTLPDPEKYETIFRSEDKSAQCFAPYDINFYGVVFESPIVVSFSEDLLTTFEKCTFRDMDPALNAVYRKCVVYHTQTAKSVIEFRECLFSKNKNMLLQGYQTPFNVGVDKYYNCTFVENEADYLFAFPGIDSGYGNVYEFVNCTFFKNKANAGFFSTYGGLRLYNCSFFDNDAKSFLSDASSDRCELSTLVGNVFLKNDFSSFLEGSRRTSSAYFDLVSHNLFQSGMTEMSGWSDNINLSDTESLEKNLFETDSQDGFVLKNNGGFTSTVALKSDKLSDGTSIRFPRLDSVLFDQRGVERLEKTCMGAYELKCTSDTTFVVDTIQVGTKILGQTFTKVGVYDNIFENFYGANGCDSIVKHSVVVTPDAKAKEYIVTNTNDDGEGSLRYAIEYANASESDSFRIKFSFKESGTHRIKIKSQLLVKRDNLIIDGSDVRDSIIIDGGKSDYNGIQISCSSNFQLESIYVQNCNNGIYLIGADAEIKNCDLTGNGTGISTNSSDVLIEKCLVSGNSEYGISTSNGMIAGSDSRCFRSKSRVTISNCIIGLDRTEKRRYPNKIGIYSSNDGGLDSIVNNTISGNLEDGVVLNVLSCVAIASNYIGVNKNGDDLGNGDNGIELDYYGNTSSGRREIGGIDLANANVIGCNEGYGVYTSENGYLGVGANYIGVTPDGKTIGNKKGGICAGSGYIDGSVICCNSGDGVLSAGLLTVKNSVIGDNTSSAKGNKGYGIHVLSRDLVAYNNKVWNNQLGGIYYEGNGGYPQTDIDASQNLFGGDQPFAIKSKNETLNIPVIKKIAKEDSIYKVYGHVDFIDGTPLNGNKYYNVDSTKVGIELFKNQGENETAYSYVGYTETDENGDWSYEIGTSLLDDDTLCLTATAIHFVLGPPGQYVDHQIDKYTSGLSDPFCSEVQAPCNTDTTFSTCTIVAGTWFKGKEYDKIGRYDNVVSNDTTSYGCDSIVIYTLNVVPDSSRNVFYVKQQGTGKETGSDWENAISAKDFAFVLGNLQSDSVTFYIAAGTYKPDSVYSKQEKGVYFANANIKGVSIIGGFPSHVKSDTLPDPEKYETIFRSEDKSAQCFAPYDINFYGVVFESPIVVSFSEDLLTTFEKCTFRDMDPALNAVYRKCVVYHTQTAKSVIEFRECLFSKNKNMLLQGYQTPFNVGVDKYYNCTFVENEADYLFAFPGIDSGYGNVYEFVNCTFFKNKANAGFFSTYGGLRLYNCSFFDNDAKSFLSDASSDRCELSTLVGNVFLKNDFSSFLEGSRRTSSAYFDLVSHNLFQSGMTEMSGWSDNINLSDTESLEKNLFETDSQDGFVLKNNGGFTSTVALKSDKLSDGTSIRFPRLEKITKDQRGVSRLEKTCMGAYEKDEETGAKALNDAICEIYPNPVKNVLNVNGCEESFSYEIIDLTGRTVSSGKSSGTIAVAALSNGVYFLKLQLANQQACLRFVKQ